MTSAFFVVIHYNDNDEVQQWTFTDARQALTAYLTAKLGLKIPTKGSVTFWEYPAGEEREESLTMVATWPRDQPPTMPLLPCPPARIAPSFTHSAGWVGGRLELQEVNQ